ncbi:hypothetical protein ANN_27813 [Periplaneta americana]|uniref:Endonuclease/exonuclease/phosphatase domain-containing protein n=1 Tax=Periplaneta americana TaxID=6978 RepID=A0ABQ8RVC6_PERAM|nr:hypothetical protein ANN_27813 [Periplaneta americana]
MYIVGIYCRPQEDPADITGKLMSAISNMQQDKPSIIAGDLNCRIDKPNQKCREVLNCLAEEGFVLVNKPETKIYFAINGSSAIDFVLYKGHNIKHVRQTGEWQSRTTTLRKHVPVVTEMNFIKTNQGKHQKEKPKRTRKLNTELLSEEEITIKTAHQYITEEDLNTAVDILTNLIEKATMPAKNKHGKPWFNRKCYQKTASAITATSTKRTTDGGARTKIHIHSQGIQKRHNAQKRKTCRNGRKKNGGKCKIGSFPRTKTKENEVTKHNLN